MAQWHQKHYSTQWGVAILGFFVVATALLVTYLNQNQNQDFRSRASFTDGSGGGSPTNTPAPSHTPTPTPKTYGSCYVGSVKGTCQDLNQQPACGGVGGSYVDGYCPGGSNIKCCIHSLTCYNYGQNHGGVGYCLSTTGPERYKYSGGWFVSGYCPGPSTVKCYFIPGR